MVGKGSRTRRYRIGATASDRVAHGAPPAVVERALPQLTGATGDEPELVLARLDFLVEVREQVPGSLVQDALAAVGMEGGEGLRVYRLMLSIKGKGKET